MFFTSQSFTTEQRIHVIQTFYENGRSVKETYRKIREFFGKRIRPSESGIRAMVKRFEETGSVAGRAQHARRARNSQNVISVIESVRNQPGTSLRRRCQELGLTYSTLWRILKEEVPLALDIVEAAKSKATVGRSEDEKADPLEGDAVEGTLAASEKETLQRKRKNDDNTEETPAAKNTPKMTETKPANEETVDSAKVPEDPLALVSLPAI